MEDRSGGRRRLTRLTQYVSLDAESPGGDDQHMTPTQPTAQNTSLPKTGGADPLAEARSENSSLKSAIEALECRRYENEEAAQNARAESADEIKQLRQTAAALRNEMENISYAKEEAIQNAISESSDEIGQLKATVQALRNELECLMVSHKGKMRDMERDRRDETRQLKETVQVLRDKLDGVVNKKPRGKK